MQEKEALQTWLETLGAVRLWESLALLYPEAATFVVDHGRAVLHWGPKAEALLGYEAKDVIGQHCRMISRCHECMVGCPISESHQGIALETTLYTRLGEPIKVRRVGVALRDQEGLFVGGIEQLHPLTTTDTNAAHTTKAHPPKSAETAHDEDSETSASSLFVSEAAQATDTFLPLAAKVEGETALHMPPSDEPIAYNRALVEDDAFVQLGELVTRDPRMKDVLATIHRLAETDATVLIQGESGTGKELVARALHDHSPRHHGPFVAVNCAALTPTLLESELFGHEKGAFTGAIARRIGLFQRAERGTIFLDEIAEIPLDLQSKMLRVIEEREVIPVGSTQPIKVDIRVISASYKSLPKQVEAGTFREDLMYRLRVVPLQLPPLRRRPDDMELLVWHFVHLFNEFGPRHITHIAPSALQRIHRYRWPGNIRELKNAMEYAFAVGRGSILLPSELPQDLLQEQIDPRPADIPQRPNQLLPAQDDIKAKITRALQITHGHVGQAAELLGMSRPTLWRKRKKYGI